MEKKQNEGLYIKNYIGQAFLNYLFYEQIWLAYMDYVFEELTIDAAMTKKKSPCQAITPSGKTLFLLEMLYNKSTLCKNSPDLCYSDVNRIGNIINELLINHHNSE